VIIEYLNRFSPEIKEAKLNYRPSQIYNRSTA